MFRHLRRWIWHLPRPAVGGYDRATPSSVLCPDSGVCCDRPPVGCCVFSLYSHGCPTPTGVNPPRRSLVRVVLRSRAPTTPPPRRQSRNPPPPPGGHCAPPLFYGVPLTRNEPPDPQPPLRSGTSHFSNEALSNRNITAST